MRGIFASCIYSALIGGLLPCTACSVVGLRWKAGVSYACVPSMVSCSGFGLPKHAQLLRLIVRVAVTIDRGAKQRIVGAGTATATEPSLVRVAILSTCTYLSCLHVFHDRAAGAGVSIHV